MLYGIDDSRRYDEPKKIGDILKDIGMDQEGIQRSKKSKEAGDMFAQETMKILEANMTMTRDFDEAYEETPAIIQSIEKAYENEIHVYSKYSLSVKNHLDKKAYAAPGLIAEQQGIIKRNLTNHIAKLTQRIEKFDKTYDETCGNLRFLIKRMCDPMLVDHYNKEVNTFCTYFLKIFQALKGMVFDYHKLMENIQKK